MSPPIPLRILTAVPVCDGHDSAITTINLELIHHGVEVVYLGYHRGARDIARAAVQEDVRAVGISSYNGGHVEFFAETLARLRRLGAPDVAVFGGGGGTILPQDAVRMKRRGVDRIFFAGTPLPEMVAYVRARFSGPVPKSEIRNPKSEIALARFLTRAEAGSFPKAAFGPAGRTARAASGGAIGRPPRVIGFTGPGGAGKTTLLDELVLRFLAGKPSARLAILSHDPSLEDKGALLGDRATMIYAQDDRVFLRSLATRGHPGGVARATARCLEILKRWDVDGKGRPFDAVFVETVGTGQEAAPFERGLADLKVLVLSPDYGSRLQLQKIAMLDLADAVVVNKADLAGARTAASEVGRRIELNRRGQAFFSTCANRHGDPGVDALFQRLFDGSHREP